MTMFHLVVFKIQCTKNEQPAKMTNVYWFLSQPKRKKDATTMACMNMILVGTLKNNMNFDILSRNCFLIYYFVLFLLDEAPERIFKI